MIFIPLLFAQMIVFPFAAGMIAEAWTDANREVALQNVANNLASVVQQFYLAINRETVQPGNFSQALSPQQTVVSYPYTVESSLTSTLTPNSSRLLTLTLTFDNDVGTVTANAVVGPNVLWNGASDFRSTSRHTVLRIQKFANATLALSFVGG